MRILVIGAGEMGRRHAGLIAGHPDCRLAGIVDPRDDAARGLDAPQFRDLDAVSGGVDAALIATPNAAHCAAVIACLDRGWPVLVEKPVTATLEEAEAVKTAAAKSGLPVLVGHHRRFHPCVGAARSLIAAGVLGRLALVQFIWAVRKPDGYFADRWRVQAGGGPVMINLIHEIDMLR
ncbi:MAG: gfo/Idh/MocA family oxidoreductase, partial [Alphaproteobacteria bacterium]